MLSSSRPSQHKPCTTAYSLGAISDIPVYTSTTRVSVEAGMADAIRVFDRVSLLSKQSAHFLSRLIYKQSLSCLERPDYNYSTHGQDMQTLTNMSRVRITNFN